MKKNILFIGDELSSFKITTDTTYSLLVSAKEIGLNIFYALASEVYLNMNTAKCRCSILKILANASDIPQQGSIWYEEVDYAEHALNFFDAVIVRKDPPFNMEYFYLTQKTL